MLPLQRGIPGGPELLVVLIILLLLIGALVVLLGGGSAASDRLTEAERRIGRLEARVEQLEDDERGEDD